MSSLPSLRGRAPPRQAALVPASSVLQFRVQGGAPLLGPPRRPRISGPQASAGPRCILAEPAPPDDSLAGASSADSSVARVRWDAGWGGRAAGWVALPQGPLGAVDGRHLSGPRALSAPQGGRPPPCGQTGSRPWSLGPWKCAPASLRYGELLAVGMGSGGTRSPCPPCPSGPQWARPARPRRLREAGRGSGLTPPKRGFVCGQAAGRDDCE